MNEICPCCKQPLDTINSVWVTVKASFEGGWHTYRLCGMCSLNIVTDYLPDIEEKVQKDLFSGLWSD